MSNTVPYILVKDNKWYDFASEKDACKFLGLSPCSVSKAYSQSGFVHGYRIVKSRTLFQCVYDKRLYKIWDAMKCRCTLKTHPHYDRYGGRGIKICDEWSRSYPLFAIWATNNGYKENLTLDRIDNDGDYTPENCRWVTYIEQANNKANNRTITYKNETHTIAEWSRITGIGKTTIKERANMGWSVEDVLFKPVRKRTRGYRPSKTDEVKE